MFFQTASVAWGDIPKIGREWSESMETATLGEIDHVQQACWPMAMMQSNDSEQKKVTRYSSSTTPTSARATGRLAD